MCQLNITYIVISLLIIIIGMIFYTYTHENFARTSRSTHRNFSNRHLSSRTRHERPTSTGARYGRYRYYNGKTYYGGGGGGSSYYYPWYWYDYFLPWSWYNYFYPVNLENGYNIYYDDIYY